MNKPEESISIYAQDALINCNKQSGALPKGTPADVVGELKAYGLISRTAMTARGRAAQARLLLARLEAL
jgi:hypothetical protein